MNERMANRLIELRKMMSVFSAQFQQQNNPDYIKIVLENFIKKLDQILQLEVDRRMV